MPNDGSSAKHTPARSANKSRKNPPDISDVTTKTHTLTHTHTQAATLNLIKHWNKTIQTRKQESAVCTSSTECGATLFECDQRLAESETAATVVFKQPSTRPQQTTLLPDSKRLVALRAASSAGRSVAGWARSVLALARLYTFPFLFRRLSLQRASNIFIFIFEGHAPPSPNTACT